MSNLKYKHTAYTSAQWASLNPVIVENEIVIESDTKRTKIGNGISTYNELEYADANSVGNSLGSIKPTDAAPTPARNGNYTFSIGGAKPAWLTAEAGVTTVKAGDGVAVVYTEPSTYSYTHVDISNSDLLSSLIVNTTGYSRTQAVSQYVFTKMINNTANNNLFETVEDGFFIGDETGAYCFKIDKYGNIEMTGQSVASTTEIKNRAVIFDTDFETDVDDALSFRILAWAERNGMVDIIGCNLCVLSTANTSVSALDAYLCSHGITDMAIGAQKSFAYQTSSYHSVLIPFPHSFTSDVQAENGVNFYRRALSSLPAGEKCDIIVGGFLTTLNDLLNSQADEHSVMTGVDIISAKVRRIYMMGGYYPTGNAEFNFSGYGNATIIAATYNFVNNCPIPIYFSGFEVGQSVITGGNMKDKTYDYLSKAMLAYNVPDGTPSWDGMNMLLGVEGDFDVSGYSIVRGINTIDQTTGVNTFTQSPDGNHYYVIKKHANDWYKNKINSIIAENAWINKTTKRVRLPRI